ncbi:SDR family NAD(P)-dependent oxidoreductase [Hyalangium versicolor]|uniref:SDR family NAD(P)-dependent oxidoreductase n=1 Tax=Hyalangium versicolor TaxID=2861190 RepID=UPI001CD008EF|nr:SDR family oxidoreductase [Hyalangium versicolor]
MARDDSTATPETVQEPDAADVARCLEVLRAVVRLPGDHPVRRTVEDAASHVHRESKKRRRRERDVASRQADRAVMGALVNARSEVAGVRSLAAATESGPQELHRTRHCYGCKGRYTRVHPFYLSLCPECARFHEDKRMQRASLHGRRALITGGRVKVGFQLALKLLRDGAHVHVLTRYPRDGARRYAQEPDFEQWRDRLVLHGIDLRFLPGVLAFTEHLLATEPHLDILVNNAAQTLRSSAEHDTALHQREQELARTLPAPALGCVSEPSLELARHARVPALTEGVLAPDRFTAFLQERADGNLEDSRPSNSWVLRLDEVPPLELLEVQCVNAMAPFLLNSRLKPLLLRSPWADRYIINVSAAEGQFQREGKTVFHPHTNMAKAALNMMTRTSAADYARDGIFMNSVDTGWFSNENPQEKLERMQSQGFQPPLDSVDGAARLYDPIVQGLRGQPIHGLFIRDYRSAPW